jgi:lipopolysaccharide transport system permease protein
LKLAEGRAAIVFNLGGKQGEISRFWQLVAVKIAFNLRAEVSVYYLSYAWWVLEPIMYMAVFYVVFGIFLARGTQDYVPFLLTGLVPWLWFAKTIGNSTLAIVSAKSLIGERRIAKSFFPLVVVGQDFVKQSLIFVLLLIYLLGYGIQPNAGWLWLFPMIGAQILLTYACALAVALAVAFARDTRFLVSTGLILGLMGSGIFYSYTDVIHPEHRALFLANPIASLLASYRNVLLHEQPPLDNSLLLISVGSALAILALHRLTNRLDNKLTRLLIE